MPGQMPGRDAYGCDIVPEYADILGSESDSSARAVFAFIHSGVQDGCRHSA